MSNARPIVVVAPDSFKGSCPAQVAAQALARGIGEVYGDTVEVRQCPLADGGEGSLDVLGAALGLELIEVDTVDALGRPRRARIGLSSDSELAVVEAAMANGLPHIADLPPAAMSAHTYGVGLLLSAALDLGVSEILLAIGGSASSDGGVGCLSALGARFLDDAGDDVPRGAAGMAQITDLDLRGLDPRWQTTTLRIAADVENPLVGERGTASVFGPQKGATPDEVRQIESGLSHLAEVLAERTGRDVASLIGGGAAGGTPAALVGLLGAQIHPGSALIVNAVGLADLVGDADLVITGEGAFDSQSLAGKVVSAVAATVDRHCPVVVLAGRVEISVQQAHSAGITALFTIARGPATVQGLIGEVELLLAQAAGNIAALVLGPPAATGR